VEKNGKYFQIEEKTVWRSYSQHRQKLFTGFLVTLFDGGEDLCDVTHGCEIPLGMCFSE
jgi:hypothetical protein